MLNTISKNKLIEERERTLKDNKKKQKEIIKARINILIAVWKQKAEARAKQLDDEGKALRDRVLKAQQDQKAIVQLKATLTKKMEGSYKAIMELDSSLHKSEIEMRAAYALSKKLLRS